MKRKTIRIKLRRSKSSDDTYTIEQITGAVVVFAFSHALYVHDTINLERADALANNPPYEVTVI